MTRRLSALTGLILAVTIPGFSLAQTLTGRQIAQRDCGACHAVGNKGASRDPVAPPFRSLGERYDISDLEEALAEGISVGHPKMPVFSYPPDQIHRLIDYLRKLQPVRPQVRALDGMP